MKPQDLHPTVWPADAAVAGSWPPAAMAVQVLATVTQAATAEASAWQLDVAGHPHVASLAPSCALQPGAGDRVLCVQALSPAAGHEGSAAPQLYILAVLARAQAADATQAAPQAARPAEWQLSPGVSLQAQGGELVLRASSLQAQATQASLHAQEVSLVYRSLHSVGELWRQTVRQLSWVGGTWRTVFDQEQHHAAQHTRTVDGVDRLQAQVVDHQADTLLHLQGQQVLANGERVVKMQGAQIHLG